MKFKIVLISLLLLGLYPLTVKSKEVFIYGKLVNPNVKTYFRDCSDIGALRLTDEGTILMPDSLGNFEIRLKLSTPTYFMIGLNIVYLSPGDKLKIMIDNGDPEKSEFLGDGSAADNYLKSIPNPDAASYLIYRDSIKTSILGSMDYILSAAQKRRDILSATPGLTPDFILMEEGRIDADIINSIKYLGGLFIKKNKIPQANKMEAFNQTIKLTQPYLKKYSLLLSNPKLLQIAVFRDNFFTIVKRLRDTGVVIPEFTEWGYAYETAYSINDAKEKGELLKLKPRIDSIGKINYRKAVQKLYDTKTGFWNGDTAIDFVSKDINKAKVSLSSFKGKVIYIELWASWCVPCLHEMPMLDTLREKYINNPNMVFISLSIDQDAASWQKCLVQRKPHGLQLLTDLSQIRPYNITGIPRTIIIDKDFKVLKMDGPTPSSIGLSNYLDAILKKDGM
jgi:thiol-disulfide isomerase/thioredoxin